MQAQIWPRDEDERRSLVDAGWGDRLKTVYRSRDLRAETRFYSPLRESAIVRGCAGSKCEAALPPRIRFSCAKSGTVRYVTSEHNLARKTIHLRSAVQDTPI